MRAYEDLAEKAAARAYDDQFQDMDPADLSPWTADDLKMIWAHGFIAGFKNAREHAAQLVVSYPTGIFHNPGLETLATLVGEIGNTSVKVET